MNVRQCRMARAALDWSQRNLADAAGVSARTVIRFEAHEPILSGQIKKIRDAFEGRGVQFIETGAMAGAVVPPLETTKPLAHT